MKTAVSENFKIIAREQGWRRTVQRLAVYEYMTSTKSHPHVEKVWRNVRERVPTITVDSVYRIVDDFRKAGVFRRLDVNDMAHYDGDASPHGHFICSHCGRIIDFPLNGISFSAKQLAELGKVEYEDIRISGVCRECLDIKNKNAVENISVEQPNQGEKE